MVDVWWISTFLDLIRRQVVAQVIGAGVRSVVLGFELRDLI